MSVVTALRTFVVGETDATRSYTLSEGGSGANRTGDTAVKLYAMKRVVGGTWTAVAAITGSYTSISTGVCSFDHTTIAAALGEYVCEIETTNASSKIRRWGPFGITVRQKVEAMP